MRRWVNGARMVITNRLRHSPARPFCSTGGDGGGKGPISKYEETYRKLDKLDFMTAAKILFTSPPKTNKFGFDFHLVQFFFACMPSLAVYLVAQYSRYEMRRMEADLEKKRKAEEEAKAKEDELKAKEDELKAIEEKENNPVIQDLLKVNVRLDKLEEAVKEIVVESKKQLNKTSTKRPNDSTERKDNDATKNGKMDVKSEKNSLEEKDQNSKGKSETLAPRSDQVDSNS